MKSDKFIYSPNGAIFLSLLVWMLIFLIPTHGYVVELSWKMVIIIAGYLIAFVLGGMFNDITIKKIKHHHGKHKAKKRISHRFVNAAITLALMGFGLRYYDLIINKDFLSYSSSVDFRSNYLGTQFGFFSLASAILFPITLILLYVYIYYKNYISNKQKFMILILAVLLVLYSIMLGGRTQLTLIFISCLYCYVTRENARKIKVKHIVFIILFGIVFFVYSSNILAERLKYQNMSTEFALLYLENKHHISLTEWLWKFFYENWYLQTEIYSFVSIRHYFIHGIYQMQLLVNTFDVSNISHGAYQYSAIFKIFGLLGLKYKDLSSIQSLLPETGVYTTFFGPTYIDFGYYGVFYMLILGFICQKVWRKSEVSTRCKLMYPLIYSICIHSFYINMIQSAMGIYYIISFIFTLYILPKFLSGGMNVEKT